MLDLDSPPKTPKTLAMSLKVLIDDQIKKLFQDNPDLNKIDKDKFEIAVSHFMNLKYFNGLDSEDLIEGIIGKGGDEGIDICYILCNGMIVKDEKHPITSDSTIKIKFVQVKKEDSFSTDGFRKFKEGIEEIFDLSIDLTKLSKIGANKGLIDVADLIRRIFRKSQVERATFSCEVYYVTISPEISISEKIKHLEEPLRKNVLSIPFRFEYIGGQKLLDLNRPFQEKLEIKFESQPLDISEKGIDTSGYAGFVRGNDLMNSLIDQENVFKAHLTEGNVRFFIGEDKAINKSIIESARDKGKATIFWAMNNGITILGDSISPLGSHLFSIGNPQIVNGCQTIHCLYYAFRDNGNLFPDNLKVFVKLVKTENINTQTDIISATNSQNPVKSASLKANDNIQRNIESHLKKYGIFYERRENFYKRQGFTGNKVIGLLKMAQIMHTVVNKESILAFNDTATLFNTASRYNSIFNKNADYDLYVYSAKLYQKIWSLKLSDLRNNDYINEDKELISRGTFTLLHIANTLLFSYAEFVDKGEKKKETLVGNILIGASTKKNEFSKRKGSLLKSIENEEYLESIYNNAKKILRSAGRKYATETEKSVLSLFKYRNFDKDFLRPAIKKFLDQNN